MRIGREIMTISDLNPIETKPVRELLKDAGMDVSDWALGKGGQSIENPNANSYRNSYWSFADRNVTVLCIWLTQLNEDALSIYCDVNMQALINHESSYLTNPQISAGEKIAIRMRLNKAREFHRMAFEAFKKRLSVRIIILGRDVGGENEAEHAEARRLDDEPWSIESFDGMSGHMRLRRGLFFPKEAVSEDELLSMELSQEVAEIQSNTELNETEKETLIKQRVGQGLFRSRLLDQWSGCCALTGCKTASLLIASHIIPWSKCETVSQRLEASNGLLLAAHIDRLFDGGYITFNERFELVIHPKFPLSDQTALAINPNMRLKRKPEEILSSLQWHRNNVFGIFLR